MFRDKKNFSDMVKEQIPCSPPGGDDPAEDLRLEAVRREASA